MRGMARVVTCTQSCAMCTQSGVPNSKSQTQQGVRYLGTPPSWPPPSESRRERRRGGCGRAGAPASATFVLLQRGRTFHPGCGRWLCWRRMGPPCSRHQTPPPPWALGVAQAGERAPMWSSQAPRRTRGAGRGREGSMGGEWLTSRMALCWMLMCHALFCFAVLCCAG